MEARSQRLRKVVIRSLGSLGLIWLAPHVIPSGVYSSDQERLEEFAGRFFAIPLPPDTAVIDQDRRLSVTDGSGGTFTFFEVEQTLLTHLSLDELRSHYAHRRIDSALRTLPFDGSVPVAIDIVHDGSVTEKDKGGYGKMTVRILATDIAKDTDEGFRSQYRGIE